MGGTRTDENTPTGHGTQKPVRLFEIPIRNHTVPGEAVYDPFVGSGTTLIAAEKTQRVAYVMDLDPAYVQVALTRWETWTGQSATRLARAATTRRRS
jgi:DNA modification methylase